MELTGDVCAGFISTCLLSNYDTATELQDFHHQWLEMCCSDDKYVAIAAPRAHSKSTTVTFGYLLSCLLFRKAKYAIIISATFGQAGQFLGDIKKELMSNEDIHGLFGAVEFAKDTEDDIIVKMEDGYTFRVQARGAEQKLRGLKWMNLRPDLVVCDDMEEDESVMNKDRREKFRRWFYAACLPILSVAGKVRVVGTVMHLDSLLERLMPESQLNAKGSKNIQHLVREPLREYSNIKLPWRSAKYRAHTDDFSKILWKSRWTADDFRTKQAEYRAQGLSDSYSQEYLNKPLDEADTYFKKDDFIPIKDNELKDKQLNYYIAADLAISQKERSDYTVFAVAGLDSEGRLYCVEVIRDRMDAMQIVSTILMLQRRYKPILFGLESGVIQKSIGPYLNEAMLNSGVFVNVVAMRPAGDKTARARSMQARMRARAVKFDKTAEWYPYFEDELMRFPRDKHDDQVDAWAYIGLLLDQMNTASTQEELDAEEYQMELRDSNYNHGNRNQTTGY